MNETGPRPPMETGHFRELFGPLDRLRYMLWRAGGSAKAADGKAGKTSFEGRFKDGTWLHIRPDPANDYGTAYEIFQARSYLPPRPLDPASVRRIIDLGGNVGYSCLFWARQYPQAKIVTCEPHPAHCRLIEEHIRRNHLSDRIQLYCCAAAARSGRGSLSDHDDASSLTAGPDSNPGGLPLIPVEIVNFFSIAGAEPLDILKMDIEGGEYEIMEDPRFEAVAGRTRYITMEWHEQSPERSVGWCEQRLSRLGFTVEAQRTPNACGAGLLWAVRF